jgi:hypothetical protein
MKPYEQRLLTQKEIQFIKAPGQGRTNQNGPPIAYHDRHDEALNSFHNVASTCVGKQALRRNGRLKLFEIYFLHSLEFRAAIKLVGVTEGTFDWLQEVKRALGKELSRCKLFPPSKYFQA